MATDQQPHRLVSSVCCKHGWAHGASPQCRSCCMGGPLPSPATDPKPEPSRARTQQTSFRQRPGPGPRSHEARLANDSRWCSANGWRNWTPILKQQGPVFYGSSGTLRCSHGDQFRSQAIFAAEQQKCSSRYGPVSTNGVSFLSFSAPISF